VTRCIVCRWSSRLVLGGVIWGSVGCDCGCGKREGAYMGWRARGTGACTFEGYKREIRS
jgi:hypothetical protein